MSDIPTPLKEAKRWILWRHLDGRKPPCDPDGTPKKNWNAPEEFRTFQEALSVLQTSKAVDGVGFVLGEGFGGLDLDKCRDVETGDIDPRAEAVIELCEGAYSEVSPSGTGVKVFGLASDPTWLELTFFDGHVRVDAKREGYFAVTGTTFQPGGALVDLPLEAIAAHFGQAETIRPKEKKRRLEETIRPGTQNTELFREACSLARKGYSEEEIFPAIRAIADQRCPPESGREPWDDASIRAIARSASRYAPSPDRFPSTESGDAEFFASKHAEVACFDHRRGKWLIWDGHRFAPDRTEYVYNFALESMRSRLLAAAGAEDLDPKEKERRVKHAIGGESVVRLDHLLKRARSLPEIARTGDEFDRDPWLLGVENGIVDLRTGLLRHAKPDDLVTMQCATHFDPDAPAGLWERTIAEVFAESPEIVPYLQRAFGYSLTGDRREEIFFLCEGTGRNGKGTLINTFASVLGDYAENLAFHSLERSESTASNDLAKLSRARFVTASESTDGKRLNEQRIKSITGRDAVTARFLYQEEFTYVPMFALWLSVNHMPRVTDDSAGFWSRPHVVPFERSFLGREDKTLKDRLLEEAPGILAWAVRGCLAWQAMGLKPPPIVFNARETYRLSQEPLAGFYEDECVFASDLPGEADGDDLRVSVGELFSAYNEWFDRNRFRFKRLGRKQFSKEVAKRVGQPSKTRGVYTFRKIGLAANGDEGDEL